MHIKKCSLSVIDQFCRINNLSPSNLELIHENRMHLLSALAQTRVFPENTYITTSRYPIELPVIDEFNRNSDSLIALSAAFGCGMYPNILYYSPGSVKYPCTLTFPQHPDKDVVIHSSSFCKKNLSKLTKSAFFAYYSIQLTPAMNGKTRAVVRDLTLVSPLVYLVCSSCKVEFNPFYHCFTLDDGILVLGSNPRNAAFLLGFRKIMSECLNQICNGKTGETKEKIDEFIKMLSM
jgi:hypothetical protein